MSWGSNELAAELERFLRELNRERFQVSLGRRPFPDTFSVYQRHAHLFDTFAIAELEERKARETGGERRRCGQIQRFLRIQYPLAMVSDQSDLLDEMCAGRLDECGPPLDMVADRINMMGSDEREGRREAWNSRARFLDELNPILDRRIRGMHKACLELGYQSLADLSLDSRGVDMGWLSEVANVILDRTETIYLETLENLLEPLSLSPNEAGEHDVLHLLHGKDFGSMFPDDQLWNSISSAALGMGGNLGVCGNLRLMSTGCGRARALGVNVPEEVYLFLDPRGGYLDYYQHFEEAGRALQMGMVSPELPVEYRFLGDKAITDSAGLMFQRILCTRNWLGGRGSHGEVAGFRRLNYLHRLFELRRTASLLLYEMRIRMGFLSTARDLYRSIMEERLHYSTDGYDFLLDIYHPFRSADRIRGFVFEALMRKAFFERSGEGWCSHPTTRETLMEMWSWGGKYDLDELANSLGYAELDIEPLIEEMEDRFRLV